MTVIQRSEIVPYTPAQMYDLVNAIEDYPSFIPWCKASHIHLRNEDEVQATLDFAKGAIQKSFTTCNRLQVNKMIEIRLLDGPFRHLEGFWKFDGLAEGGTQISLDMEFEFANKLLSMAFSPIFHQATNALVDVFCQRANDVYGLKLEKD
jgi:ribosome-associated toxin RatA of RatAB toxin-antitoxin module